MANNRRSDAIEPEAGDWTCLIPSGMRRIGPHGGEYWLLTLSCGHLAIQRKALAQRQARHASPATTARYDKRQEGALRRLLAGASTGYKPR